ncbi:sigma-E processing peptidase SpoIIGA [Halalkalibacillus halophilus]|uniref:sigma-E processing peptidase SpoIIGA n=1 Tax=Halalkalibacillus halophilus TaxID=392827 RepID=UPI00040355C8|nr:sigma-E processing peptidase SpoIIGA [Halalkalibacillus halophilus]
MHVYTDLVWLLNFLFDWMILLLVGWALRVPFSKKRIVLAALFASIYVPLSLYVSFAFIESFLFKLVYSVFIILIAFSFHSVKQLCFQYVCFYFINFTIGGGIFALSFLYSDHLMFLTHDNRFGNPFSWATVLILFPMIYFLTKSHLNKLTIQQTKMDQVIFVSLFYKGITAKVKGYMDTGNELRHPLNKRPVILMNRKTFQLWFGEKLTNQFEQIKDYQDLNSIRDHSFQIVPFQHAGGRENKLTVLLLDKVILHHTHDLETKKIYVGLHDGKFSTTSSYDCLLHPHLIQSTKLSVQESIKGEKS